MFLHAYALGQREINKKPVGPSLAQLVERLAHRYSESTSSNPGNLTSAKRSASVAPEVDLRERTLRLPPQCE